MLCDYFLSSVTEGVQPNAEQSGTGLQEDSHGGCGSACTQTHTHTCARAHKYTYATLSALKINVCID